jgi:hypothetical protein
MLLHADWPNYPAGEGSGFALTALGRFPDGTNFRLVDDIDACALLVAEQYGSYDDPYDRRAFHVAIWHEDLLELADSGFITGVRRLTEREYEEQKRDRMRADLRKKNHFPEEVDPLEHLYWTDGGGTLRQAEFPSLDEYDRDDEEIGYEAYRRWLGMRPDDRIQVTRAGAEKLEELWSTDLQIPQSVEGRIRYLLEGGLYDSALRDLGAVIESRMKDITGFSAYGWHLVEQFTEHLLASNRYISAEINVLRSELRVSFKFYRNEFAHNLVDLPKGRAYALVSQMCDIIDKLENLASFER